MPSVQPAQLTWFRRPSTCRFLPLHGESTRAKHTHTRAHIHARAYTHLHTHTWVSDAGEREHAPAHTHTRKCWASHQRLSIFLPNSRARVVAPSACTLWMPWAIKKTMSYLTHTKDRRRCSYCVLQGIQLHNKTVSGTKAFCVLYLETCFINKLNALLEAIIKRMGNTFK